MVNVSVIKVHRCGMFTHFALMSFRAIQICFVCMYVQYGYMYSCSIRYVYWSILTVRTYVQVHVRHSANRHYAGTLHFRNYSL